MERAGSSVQGMIIMRKFHATLLAGTMMLASSLAALAADMPAPPPIERAPSLAVEEFGSGWYLRGDLGYSNSINPKGWWATTSALSGGAMDDSFTVGGGFGYKLSWIRMDMTADWRGKSDFTAGGLGRTFNAQASGLTVLGNVYFDLGTWHGITPYVGGGVGGSYNSISGASATNPAVNLGKSNRWDTAWALMAGAGIDIAPNTKLDAGYRYINMGSGRSGPEAATLGYLRIDDMAAHEFRLGVRITVD